MSDFLEQLNKAYFWDIDPDRLDEVRSKRVIIERILNYGNIKDIQLLRKRYEAREIINTARELNYIDRKTLNFISALFNVPKTGFKCWRRKPLTNQHWNY